MGLEIITAGLTAVNSAALAYVVWFANNTRGKLKNQMVIDTSGLIDGRLVDIVQSGFVPQRIIVPQFVVAELQLLADQGDSFKRERARFGLDVVRHLQDMRQTEVIIKPGMARGIKEVDDKLVALAKRTGAMLYTTDFNLNKVAEIEGVRVLNVNELAQALRGMHLPGEKSEIKITQVGQDRTQGVGYLEDGTMVVVEKAGNKIGQKVHVEFSRMLQTQAGKMMFATLRGEHIAHDRERKPQAVYHAAHAKPEHPKAPEPVHEQPQQQPKPRNTQRRRRRASPSEDRSL
ncbi:MAG TPA: TRAM domain-containing protein [Candidatus Saccharimonadales bacterium]|nr:TRAM domain-containing protein [Candidatus Saccharimonadales bacterium]